MNRATAKPAGTIAASRPRRLRVLAMTVAGVLCATLLPLTAPAPEAFAEGLSGSVVVHDALTPTTGDGLRTPDEIGRAHV